MAFLRREREEGSVPREPFDLATALLVLALGDRKGKRPPDIITIGDACEGTLISGGTGTGKSSGSGKAYAHSFLANGFGGIVCCAKPEERRLWEKYAESTGRSQDLIVFSPDQPWRCNFFDYELRRKSKGGGQTENLVNLLAVVMEIVEGKQRQSTGEPFWDRAGKEMLRPSVDLLALGRGTLSLEDICRFVLSAPRSKEEYESEKWLNESFCSEVIQAAIKRSKDRRQQHDLAVSALYWTDHFPNLDNRTRSGIVATFTSVADILNHGIGWDLLATTINLVPEMTYQDGKIIILDTSIQEYGELGRIVQGIMKYVFQRAVLRRDAKEFPRPVFLWADEAQNFVSSFDYQFQAVARSARACTVYLTQNISNFYAVLGSNGRDEANALTGNFQTKIFHANSDYATNQWASDTIGKHWVILPNQHMNFGPDGQPTYGSGGTPSLQYKVEPTEFTTLRKGGPANKGQVDAIVFQGGRIFNATGDTYLPTVFQQ